MKNILIILCCLASTSIYSQGIGTGGTSPFQGTNSITPVDATGKLTIDGTTVIESNFTATHSAIIANNSVYRSSTDNSLYWKNNTGDSLKIHTQDVQELTGITTPTIKANTVTTFTGGTAVVATLASEVGTWLVTAQSSVSTLQFANATITDVSTNTVGGFTADLGFTYLIVSEDGVNYQASKLGGSTFPTQKLTEASGGSILVVGSNQLESNDAVVQNTAFTIPDPVSGSGEEVWVFVTDIDAGDTMRVTATVNFVDQETAATSLTYDFTQVGQTLFKEDGGLWQVSYVTFTAPTPVTKQITAVVAAGVATLTLPDTPLNWDDVEIIKDRGFYSVQGEAGITGTGVTGTWVNATVGDAITNGEVVTVKYNK